MNMCYFWTISKQDDKTIDVLWHPERVNIADYSSKHHYPTIIQNLRPTYLHITNSPIYLQLSVTPHLLRGCAKNSPRSVLRTHVLPYRGMVPPQVQKTVTQHNWVRTIYHHKLLVAYFDRTAVFYPLSKSTCKKRKSFRSNVVKKEDTLANKTATLTEKKRFNIYILKLG